METHATVEFNGIEFAYLHAGEGPVVVCLHGYPDTPQSFDVLMPRLVAAGFRVIAPYLRGYAPTGLAPTGEYGGMTLGEDVVALMDALGVATARIVGHDWGAFATYLACNIAPERFTQAVTLAIPHPLAIGFSPRVLLKANHFLFYQLPWIPEWWLRRNDFAAIDALWRKWSPGIQDVEAETEAVKRVFRQPGALKAALAYYRSLRANPFSRRSRLLNRTLRTKTQVPTLALYGEDDGVLSPALYQRSARAFTAEYSFEGLPGCGHFLLRERPDAVCDRILSNFVADRANLERP